MRRTPLLVASLALVAAACTGGSATTTTGGAAAASTSTTAAATATTVAPATTLDLSASVEGLPAALAEQVAELIEVTQELRELPFLEPPTVVVVSNEELAERVRDSIQEETEDVDADQALYRLLGLLPAEVDLLALYTDLYGEQVAGFYDGEAEELVIPAGETSLSPLQQSTLVHELTHALVDQHFDAWVRYDGLAEAERFDEAGAFLALMEGDAVLTELLFVMEMSPADRQDLIAESLQAETDVFAGTPPFIQRSLLFPYQDGLTFVQRLHDLGGFERVDGAYRDLPASTEQILTPRAYQRDEPLDVAIPEFDLAGYQRVYDTDWGALGFDLMFGQVLGGRAEAVEGWGGDRFLLWFDGAEVAFVLVYQGDAPADAEETAAALAEYVPAAMAVGAAAPSGSGTIWAGDDYAFLARSGDQVVFVGASLPEVGEQLRSAYAGA